MNNDEIVKDALNNDISQQDLAYYLDITRQTVASIRDGKYVKLNNHSKQRLMKLVNKNKTDMKKMLAINKSIDDIKERILSGDSTYIDNAYEGIHYMHYWLTDTKFVNQERYHKYYYGHMNNFYPRFNQAALFMRDTLNRQRYPLVTVQVNYEKKQISDFCIKAFVKEYDSTLYNTVDIDFPISFETFFIELKKRVEPKPRFLIYKDYKDDEWRFILNHYNKSWFKENEIYDLSRLFNFFENQQAYYGPLIEDVLTHFKISYEISKLLKDCHYRANKIIELINLVSLENLHKQKYDKSSMLFDSHGFKRDNRYIEKERRKLKGRG